MNERSGVRLSGVHLMEDSIPVTCECPQMDSFDDHYADGAPPKAVGGYKISQIHGCPLSDLLSLTDATAAVGQSLRAVTKNRMTGLGLWPTVTRLPSTVSLS